MITTINHIGGCRVVRARDNSVFDPVGSRAPQALGLRVKFTTIARKNIHNQTPTDKPKKHKLKRQNLLQILTR
ncbi:MAG: hypothetical protein FWH37_07115, partial [Candidatus Bathyarchaeota archaeon]|nr:hypothetical protein [Candidatus Termiticorpusculum sp.]